ncbi:HEAT repeat domain-containing protein [Rhodocaloribacter sp.]
MSSLTPSPRLERIARRSATGLWLCLVLGALVARAQAPPYDHPLFTGPVHDAPLQPFDLEHLRLDAHLDPEEGRLSARARFRMTRLEDSLATLLLSARDLAVAGVRVRFDTLTFAAAFRHGGKDSLLITLDTLPPPGRPFEVEVAYTARPRRGLYVRPAAEPDGRPYVWTSAAPETQAHWLPVLPAPGDRFTTDLRLTVDRRFHALAPGRLVETLPNDDGTVTYRFVNEKPYPSHALVTAAGVFETEETVPLVGGREMSFASAARPERRAEAARTFAHAPEIARFFSTYLRYPLPGPGFTALALPDLFPERIAAPHLALFDDGLLADRRAALDENPDGPLAEALAAQWFGMLISADYWTDRWLDDALPAFLSARFLADEDGESSLELLMESFAERYFDEARRYRRPLVWDRWEEPGDLLDAHGRDKGAWVLFMLWKRMGDEAFRSALNRYLHAYDYATAGSEDLRRMLEAEAGVRLDDFFDAWVYAAGHPVLDVTYAYDAAHEALSVTVRQTQEGFLVPEVFEADLDVEVGALSGPERFPVRLTRREQTFTFPLPMPPRYVLMDAGDAFLAEIRTHQPAAAWVGQLTRAEAPVHRLRAARALRAFRTHPDLLLGLRSALSHEPEARVRTAVVETMASLPPSPSVERALLAALADDAPDVRRAALDGLAAYPDDDAVAARALALANTDPSARVQAAAVRTLARLGAPNALDVVRSALVTPSHRDVIRRAALAVLPGLPMPPREALTVALTYSTGDRPAGVRAAAVPLLAHLAEERRRARRRLFRLLADPHPGVRRAALDAVAAMGTPEARQTLERRLAEEPEPRLARRIRQALDRL